MSEVLVLARQLQGWSQEDVARAMGIKQQSVSAWETGESTPSKKNVVLLETVLPFEYGELVNAWAREDYSAVVERLTEQLQAAAGTSPPTTEEELARRADRVRVDLQAAIERAGRVAAQLDRSGPPASANDRQEPGA